jgi:hypothetical protein
MRARRRSDGNVDGLCAEALPLEHRDRAVVVRVNCRVLGRNDLRRSIIMEMEVGFLRRDINEVAVLDAARVLNEQGVQRGRGLGTER